MAATRKGTADAADAATYISGLARELRAIAKDHDFDFLAYLLAMAEDEARATAQRASERGSDSAAA